MTPFDKAMLRIIMPLLFALALCSAWVALQ